MRYIVFFFISLLICYGSDLAPYYVALFAGKNVSVIGDLLPFAEPCPDSPRDDIICAVQYRIPHRYIEGHSSQETLGLGLIIQTIEVSCDGESQPVVKVSEYSTGSRMKNYYETYHTVPLSLLKCQGDVLVKNWLYRSYRRFGYSNAPAAIGEANWIARIKDLSEFFHGELNVLFGAIFLMFYLLVRSLKRLTYFDLIMSPFDHWSLYWFWFSIISSDLVMDLFLPFNFEHWVSFVFRLTYFYGIMMTLGPVLTFIGSAKRFPDWLTRPCSFLVMPRPKMFGFSAFVVIGFAANILKPLFFLSYGTILVIAGVTSLITSVLERNSMMFFFALAALSDACKVKMIPYFPAPRFVIVYMGIVLLHSIIKKIKWLETTAAEQGKTDLALQVAHDIRSPLNTLSLLVPKLRELPEDTRTLVLGATQRIQEIAKDLVSRHKRSVKEHEGTEAVFIPYLLEKLVAETRIQVAPRKNIQIVCEQASNLSLFCKINPVQLIRAISNIVNNSIESFDTNPGVITLKLSANESSVFVTVEDNGPGIPDYVLKDLGKKGKSYGKTDPSSGAGLGVHHAKLVAEEWGGSLSIKTEVGKGTQVTFHLPREKSPKWFTPSIQIPAGYPIFIVDDDSLIHAIWDKRLQEIGISSREIYHFQKLEQIEVKKDSAIFYLVDYYLPGSLQNGIEFIESVQARKNSVLVTDNFEDPIVRAKCEALGIRLMPKMLAPTIPVSLKR